MSHQTIDSLLNEMQSHLIAVRKLHPDRETPKDGLLLIAALRKAIEQRDGYRGNYWAVINFSKRESAFIAKENDFDILEILQGKGGG